MIEKEFSAKNQAFTFLLPKTPSEKRHHSKRKKNTLISECSAINSNPNSNGTVNLDNTMSTRSKAKRVSMCTIDSMIIFFKCLLNLSIF